MIEKVRVGWGKSKNDNRVDSFIWHLRVEANLPGKSKDIRYSTNQILLKLPNDNRKGQNIINAIHVPL